MAGKFEHKPFSRIDLSDPFFDSLKKDYPGFDTDWFPKAIKQNREALVFSDENGLGAFIALKPENEEISLVEKASLPALPRLKISTFRLAERFRGQRLGEGAMGLVLWDWQRSRLAEIYVTVFPKHTDLISLLEGFGFIKAGYNARGEFVYIRSRAKIDYSDPYKAFPFISPQFNKGGYLIVEDNYHDTLFPYSELKNTVQEQLDMDVANGITKVYIGKQWKAHYQVGEPIFIYRKYTGVSGTKRYKSCVTSFCVATAIEAVKRNGRALISFDQFCSMAGNKSVFTKEDLMIKYRDDRNITIIRLLYCGYFGSGNNVNMDWLDTNKLWSKANEYPADVQLSMQQCNAIWLKGGIDVANIFGGD